MNGRFAVRQEDERGFRLGERRRLQVAGIEEIAPVSADPSDAEVKARVWPPAFRPVTSWWRSRVARWFEKPDPVARSYRFLARQLAADLPYAERGRTILVSSLGPVSLANDMLLTFAWHARDELGCRLLLVDGTFRQDGISPLLDEGDVPGLHNLLYDGEYQLLDVVRPTERAGIFFLPAGRPLDHALPPSESSRISALFDEARSEFDYILLQQASILTDSRYLLFASIADLLLLVVEEGGATVADLEQCEKLVRAHQISNAQIVLAGAG